MADSRAAAPTGENNVALIIWRLETYDIDKFAFAFRQIAVRQPGLQSFQILEERDSFHHLVAGPTAHGRYHGCAHPAHLLLLHMIARSAVPTAAEAAPRQGWKPVRVKTRQSRDFSEADSPVPEGETPVQTC